MPAKTYRYKVLQTTFAHDPKLDCPRLYAPGEILHSPIELQIGLCLPIDHIGACDANQLVPNLELTTD